jgi:hypothetical protein
MIQQLIEIRNNILSALEQNDGILAKMAVNDLNTLLHDLSNQQEKTYNEEEVKNLFSKYQYDLAQWVLRMEDDINGRPIPTEWFEQYKKK